MTLKSFCFGLLLLPMIFGVSMDYLLPFPRAQSINCQSTLHQAYCQIKCGKKESICVKDNCFCLSSEVAKEIVRENENDNEEDYVSDYDENNEAEVQDQTRIENLPIYALRPTVRHHIAHFCPNLDIARQCIKKCMAQGKPAFCGKDHVCYCGHKYSNTDKNSDVNIKEMYEQFHDLYTKYFGADKSVEL